MTQAITTADALAMPIIVSFGAGVDSTAVLVGLWMKGIRPAAILFADTGGELPETYDHVWRLSAWLVAVGLPAVTIVRYVPKTAPYDTLEGNMLANATLPSLAFGFHSCSLKFKVEPQDKWVRAHYPQAHVVRVVGYDNGARDTKRAGKAGGTYAKPTADALWHYWYPLQEWGWDRAQCLQVIEAAGAPSPAVPLNPTGKSSCFFCPARTKPEILALRATHPDLYARACHMEEVARTGKHGLRSAKGLGRRFAWSDEAALATVGRPRRGRKAQAVPRAQAA